MNHVMEHGTWSMEHHRFIEFPSDFNLRHTNVSGRRKPKHGRIRPAFTSRGG